MSDRTLMAPFAVLLETPGDGCWVQCGDRAIRFEGLPYSMLRAGLAIAPGDAAHDRFVAVLTQLGAPADQASAVFRGLLEAQLLQPRPVSDVSLLRETDLGARLSRNPIA